MVKEKTDICGFCFKHFKIRNNLKKPNTFTNISQEVREIFCSKGCKCEYIEKIKSNSKN